MSEEKHSEEEKDKSSGSSSGPKSNTEFYVQLAAIVILAGLLMYSLGQQSAGLTGGAIIGSVSASDVIPTGVPAVYGSELGISYDDVNPNDPRLADRTIEVLGNLDRTTTLTGSDLERYIGIVSQISCEYCCGAKSVIFENGQPACGCAHSYAMRGLGKYLVQNHPEMTDEEILSEIGKWKVLFFPGIHEQKAQALESQGIDSKNYVNLASNKYRGIEKGQSSGGGMVGGC